MKWRQGSSLFLLMWVGLFFLSLPFPLNSLTHPAFYTESFFVGIDRWLYALIVGQEVSSSMLSSDSELLFVQVLFLAFCSLCISLLWIFFSKKEIHFSRYLAVVSTYILSFFLLKYGFDKVFKHQFYSPEPNILYTPLGFLSKDILFWSTMGTSYTYSFFCGMMEVIPGLLLLHKRTRKAGSLIAFAVLAQVFVINLSFDITVKILSGSLLVVALCALIPYFKELYSYFFSRAHAVILKPQQALFRDSLWYRIAKFVIVFFILFESLFHAFSTGNFNDDLEKRPPFHGAYDVLSVDGDRHKSPIGDLSTVKRIFIHRQGYLITQNNKDEFKDFALHSFGTDRCMILKDSQQTGICFSILQDKRCKLKIENKTKHLEIQLLKVDLKKLPVNFP